MRPIPRRAWRLILASRYLLACPKVSPKQLQHLVGHFTFLFMVRIPLLSVFGSLYRLISRGGVEPLTWWPSVKREIAWAAALIPLAYSSLKAKWLPRLMCTDASEWGRGMLQKDLDAESVAKLGRVRERWRFRSEGMDRQPREQQLALNIQAGQQQYQAAAVCTATSGRQHELLP